MVYGYAFRDHWHWYNGIKFNDGYYVSIVLWKDYNCKQWDYFAQTNYSQPYVRQDSQHPGIYLSVIVPITNSVNTATPASTNIWQAAYNLGKAFETDSRTKDYAFTVVATQNVNAYFYGCFCAQGYAALVDTDFNSIVGFGKVFLLQIR